MSRVLDTGEFWFKVEKRGQAFVLYRRIPSHLPDGDKSAWQQVHIEREFNPSHQTLVNQINDFFASNFILKKNDLRKKIYVDDLCYFKIIFSPENHTLLLRAKKTEAALSWEKDRLEEDKAPVRMDEKTIKILENSLVWETVFDGHKFTTHLERNLVGRLSKFFELSLDKIGS
jgi:hypothetical protein